MFNAHGNKILDQDQNKEEFEIYIKGTKKKCEDMQKEFNNLHALDLSEAVKRVPFMYRRKVAQAKGTKLEKMQEQLSMLLIYLEVNVDEL